MTLAERVLAGDSRAIARAISLIENEDPQAPGLVRAIFGKTGHAYLVGVTGPPGAGKSTLVDRMTAEIRSRGQTVGVLTVDPTSPFSGGAVLGDRLRMQGHAADEGVFIRSMATSAGWRGRPATPRSSSTPQGKTSSSSRPSESGRMKSISSGRPTSPL